MKNIVTYISILVMFCFQYPQIGFSQSPLRAVLIEEFTGEWCGYCPIGMMELDNMAEKYGDTLIIVAVHFGDQLEPASASGMIGAWANFAPSALINRTHDTSLETQVFGPDDWDEVITTQIESPAPCNVHLTYSYNGLTKEIVATVTATFTEGYVGDGRLNLYIVEDSVIGISQSNYLSGNPNYINTPFYSLPEHIPNFAHQHVLREMVGGSYGIDGIIPDTVYSGNQFQYTFNYTIPDDYNLENLHIIGVAQQYKGLKKYRKILNSTHYKFDPSMIGLKEYSSISDLIFFPMPAENYFNLKMSNGEQINKVHIYSIDGKHVFSKNTGNTDIQIDSQNFPNGYYIIRVETDENNYHGKIIIRK